MDLVCLDLVCGSSVSVSSGVVNTNSDQHSVVL